MTSAVYMAIVGVYIMLYGQMRESVFLEYAGLITATAAHFVVGHVEDEYKYRLERLEKAEFERSGKNG